MANIDCEKIKDIIPRYVNHTASAQDIQSVEEHLCICAVCREHLGGLLDQEKEFVPAGPEFSSPPVAMTRWDKGTMIIIGIGIVVFIFLFLLLLKGA